MQFDHEKLDVYKVSLEFNRLVHGLVRGMGANYRALKDQLIRSSLSIPLNIAEGNGKRTNPDRNRFFEIAREEESEYGVEINHPIER